MTCAAPALAGTGTYGQAEKWDRNDVQALDNDAHRLRL